MVLEAVAVLEQQQLGLVDRRGRHRVGQAIGRAGRKGDQETVLEQLSPLDLAAGEGEGEEHAIELAALERVAGRLAGLLAQVELEVRPLIAQSRKQGRKQERSDGRDHAHPELAGERLAGRAHHVRQILGLAQDPLRLFRHPDAERGEAHHAPRPLDEHHADQRLELLDSGRKGRLGDEARLRGAAEMAVVAQRDQILELLQSG